MIRRSLQRLSTAAMVAAAAAASTPAESAQTTTWEDLIPPTLVELEAEATQVQRRYMALDPRTRRLYQAVGHELSVRERLASGITTEDELGDVDRGILERKPSAQSPEAVEFWREVDKLNDAMDAQNDVVNPAMDGRTVRLPGYVLPLELSDARVKEFLLVPYVGACIHTPPPPRNQMVHVTVPEGFESHGLYTPVWVEGTMSTGGAEYEVSFIDGSSAVAAGYTITATRVEKYEQ